ncbi:hypothetical protein KR222_000730, partial [Zaprionus bogoriensis]
ISDNVVRLLLGLLLLAVVGSVVQGQGFKLSVGETLQPLTNEAAFRIDSSPVSSLRSNFQEDTLRKIAIGAQEFGLDLLTRISTDFDRDFMISPFSVWSLLILLYEGAAGQTFEQLRQVLRVNVADEDLRGVYRVWSSYLNVNTSTIEVASLQALYTDKTSPVLQSYRDAIQAYGVQPVEVDFYARETVAVINEATNKSTRGLIPYTVLPQHIIGAKMFIMSSLFFKGQWKYPFNETLTRTEPFYDESGSVVAQVEMMAQEGDFAFVSNLEGLDGYVLELPYGKQDRLSMIIVLPKRGFTLKEVAVNIQTLGLAPILQRIKKFRNEVPDDNVVEVLMPKFTTQTDFNLKHLLTQMGIRDIFDQTHSNLSRLANGLYTQLCVHSTKIIVDEKGTTVAAVTSATLSNKSSPPKFYLNRPFQYMIVEKATSLLLFAGQVRKPVSK